MRLENWCLVFVKSDPYKAPEQIETALIGKVYDHPNHEDGKTVMTSLVMGKRNNKVVTYSGSEYELGEVLADYEEEYPDAKNRVLASLKEI